MLAWGLKYKSKKNQLSISIENVLTSSISFHIPSQLNNCLALYELLIII